MAKRTRSTYNKKYLEKLETSGKRSAETGQKRLYKELRLKEKAANERMRQLEKAGIDSPAYQSVQAKLEVLGKSTKGNRGRRFSETGKATYNEKELLNKILDEFLGQQTSTIKGAKKYEKDIWDTANKNQKLAEAGISREDWLKFWENMPDKKDRLYGSSQNVAMIRAFTIKRAEVRSMSEQQRREMLENGELTETQLSQFMDDAYTVQEIADEIQASKNLKAAYNQLGLTYKEVSNARIKRTNK